jgi:hypothetical protein
MDISQDCESITIVSFGVSFLQINLISSLTTIMMSFWRLGPIMMITIPMILNSRMQHPSGKNAPQRPRYSSNVCFHFPPSPGPTLIQGFYFGTNSCFK